MKKIYAAIALLLLTWNPISAQELELSDVIREAREAQIKEQAKQKAEEAMQPVKNETTKCITESNTTENSTQTNSESYLNSSALQP